MSFVHRRGPVFYASLPCAAETPTGPRTNGAGEKHRLISILLDRLGAVESPIQKFRSPSDGSAFPIQVVRDPLGRPHLLLGKYQGPAISFSKGGGRVWAALCGGAFDVGIDAAGTDEFQGGYPFHRVFHEQELRHALRLAGGDLGKASALLWSIKEAAVKAMGCAFHFVDPRQIHVSSSVGGAAGGDGGNTFSVSLSHEARVRFPIGSNRSIWVRSLPQAKMWLSIALLDRQNR